ncbi:hypothetical protein CEXT_686741 [Caerostris extrusa]|uniref:Uncharacterized protein n=1 Tax=Caerostris extrusa TaxID=172846 RepID=A0AAV4N8H3_CAEEX|nr:hypothetical protein CEXT_686741 [Caerostris extrusa]
MIAHTDITDMINVLHHSVPGAKSNNRNTCCVVLHCKIGQQFFDELQLIEEILGTNRSRTVNQNTSSSSLLGDFLRVLNLLLEHGTQNIHFDFRSGWAISREQSWNSL